MAPPVKGLWASRSYLVEPATNVWGTGINDVHYIYGAGPPERVSGRAGATSGLAPGQIGTDAPVTPPAEGGPGYVEGPPDWGFDHSDINGLDVFADPGIAIHGVPFVQDGWPSWDETTDITRAYTDSREVYPVGAEQASAEGVRGTRYGPRDEDSEVSNEIPTETVSEGWTNKNRGMIADAEPSDPSQYERQTSMQQRYAKRNNQHSVERGTDDPRTDIESRVGGQKLKTYSGEVPGSNRHYDMFPYQADQMPRPFRYRVAGTGYISWMEANAWWQRQPLRRTPPADPSAGIPETGTSETDFGYTPEDNFYA